LESRHELIFSVSDKCLAALNADLTAIVQPGEISSLFPDPLTFFVVVFSSILDGESE
jgi:hypothetical protein